MDISKIQIGTGRKKITVDKLKELLTQLPIKISRFGELEAYVAGPNVVQIRPISGRVDSIQIGDFDIDVTRMMGEGLYFRYNNQSYLIHYKR